MFAEGTYDASHAASSALRTSRRPELLALTSIRFFAAIEVVLQHTLFELGGDAAQAIPAVVTPLLTGGGLAVSFFFVLSGFILTYTYCDGEHQMKTTPGKFWRARFARIYPLYFLGFLMDGPRVLVFFLGPNGMFASAIAKIGVAGVAYLSLLQAWHPRVTNTWNTPGWTLSVEAFFYALFPLLLRITSRWPFRRLFGAALALWAVPILAQAILFHFQATGVTSANSLTFWRSFPPLRLPEFVLGVATGRLFLSTRIESRWNGLGALAVALLLALAIAGRALPVFLANAPLGGPLFALAILAFASGAIPTPNWLNAAGLVLLGRASYAVYILHQPFKQVFLMLAHLARFDAPSPALLVAYLVSLQLVCIGLFLWFEDPMRRRITRSTGG